MKKLLFISLLLLSGCAAPGLFEPGPNQGPSIWELSVKEAARSYDESPWEDFGTTGAAVAGTIALLAGVRKGLQVRRQRQAQAVKEAMREPAQDRPTGS